MADATIASREPPRFRHWPWTVTYPEVAGKRLALLKETLPRLSRAALLVEPAEIPNWSDVRQVLDSTARALAVQLQILEVSGPSDFDRAFNHARQGRAEGILTIDTAKLLFHLTRLSELAARNRLPSVGEFRSFAESGLLMTYGAALTDLTRRAATFVDKILKGAKPADLPIKQPTRLDLVVNLKNG